VFAAEALNVLTSHWTGKQREWVALADKCVAVPKVNLFLCGAVTDLNTTDYCTCQNLFREVVSTQFGLHGSVILKWVVWRRNEEVYCSHVMASAGGGLL
jgi:hypothetical protein